MKGLRRGDVVTVGLPEPTPADPSHVQAGRRPAVVVQADNQREIILADRRLPVPTIVVVPLTKNLKARFFPGTVEIARSDSNGLSHDSIALCYQIATLDLRDIKNRLGTLSDVEIASVDQALVYLLGLEP